MHTALHQRRHPNSKRPLAHHVARSWERCLNEYHLNPDRIREPQHVGKFELDRRRDAIADYLGIAATEIANLYQQISGSGSAILLTDRDGVVMKVVGDSQFLDTTRREGFQEGVLWSERACGTNGMGTCLYEKAPVLIHHQDHFFTHFCSLTCAAAPIFDPQGELLGVLNASSNSPLAQQYSVALVKMSAQMIENRLFLAHCAGDYLIRFHSRLEFVGALGEGVMAFDPDGGIRAMNGTAQFQFDVDWQADGEAENIDDYFDVSIAQLMRMAHSRDTQITQLRCARSGRRFYASVQAPLGQSGTAGLYLPRPPQVEPPSRSNLQTIGRQRKHGVDASRLMRTLPLDQLEHGDARVETVVATASRAMQNRAVPILLTGETGAGKTQLARSLHQHWHPDGQFLHINCAACDGARLESLIGDGQSALDACQQLCEPGNNTLFLDEIGDASAELQAALLPLLEAHEQIQQSGDNAPLLQIISATQHDPNGLLESGALRSDLYYRLAGVTLAMPPLREREDFDALLDALDIGEGGIDKRARSLLRDSDWGGNIRQLQQALRVARLNAAEAAIELCHLPEEARQRARADEDAPITARLTPLEGAERETLLQSLESNAWSVSRVSRLLGLSRNTVYRKMQKYDIAPKSNH